MINSRILYSYQSHDVFMEIESDKEHTEEYSYVSIHNVSTENKFDAKLETKNISEIKMMVFLFILQLRVKDSRNKSIYKNFSYLNAVKFIKSIISESQTIIYSSQVRHLKTC